MPRSSNRALAAAIVTALLALLAPAAHAQDNGTAGTARLGSSIIATLPSGHVEKGARVPITGTVTGPAGRSVEIQHRASNGTWVPLAHTTTRSDGSFSVNAPTWWVAKQTLRAYAVATADLEAAATTNTGTITVGRPYRARGSNRATYVTRDPYPGRWDPCRVLTYRINPHRMWQGGARLVKKAFAEISSATGLRFEFAGTTKVVPLKPLRGSRSGRTTNPTGTTFVIGWSTPKVVPQLTGGTVGLGGPGGVSWRGALHKGDWVEFEDDGQVVFDVTQRLTKGQRYDLALHEIGHAIGLGHVSDRHLIMNFNLEYKPLRHYGRGDLRGLAHLGADNGCFTSGASDRSRLAASVPLT
jgi:hypothetical protein